MISVAMMGARRDYQVPLLLSQRGMLDRFFTDFYIGNKPWLRRTLAALPASLKRGSIRRMENRFRDGLPPSRVVSFDWEGLLNGATPVKKRSAMRWVTASERFCQSVVRAGFPDSEAVYAANGTALEIFHEARRLGKRCLLEQFAAPMRVYHDIVVAERSRWPAWETTPLDTGSYYAFADREIAEWQSADVIFCPSEFVHSMLVERGVSPEVCKVLPYAFESSILSSPREKPHRDGLNVLFIGGVLLAKGVQYLLEALRSLNDPRISCRIVGHVHIDRAKLAKYSQYAEFTGPLPRTEVGKMYEWADVFVLPTLCEGSAVVNYEALAAGLPVITTPNAGSVVRDGVDGHIVPAGDIAALATVVGNLRDHRSLRMNMSQNATQRAREFSVQAYGKRLEAAICKTLRESVAERPVGVFPR